MEDDPEPAAGVGGGNNVMGGEAETKCVGCLRRRTIWVPTWRGFVMLLLLLGLAVYGGVRGIHPFLATDAPVAAQVMVVEGWIPVSALEAAAERFNVDGYQLLCTVGAEPPRELPDHFRNDALIVADQFLEMGFTSEQVKAIPAGAPERDRTYTSAAKLRDWFNQHGGLPEGLNVVTVGAHSRRSRLLFKEAFGDEVEVGVISMPDPAYDAAKWWRYSEGVKNVLSEGAAYLYARFLFRPE